MELSTFLSIFLGFHNLTSIHAPNEDSKTVSTNLTNSEPMLDNLAANDLNVPNNTTIANKDNITDINATTASLAVVPRDCCCHKEEPHYCDKSCQAFVIFALLSILLVAFLQANPAPTGGRGRRSLPARQLQMLGNERQEWRRDWDTQMNRFYAEIENTTLKRT